MQTRNFGNSVLGGWNLFEVTAILQKKFYLKHFLKMQAVRNLSQHIHASKHFKRFNWVLSVETFLKQQLSKEEN